MFTVMTGSMLSYTDRHASYAIREILEWGIKTLIFLDPFQDLKKEHGEQSIENLAAYITQVYTVDLSNNFWKIIVLRKK